jgi:probable rRNA maturation factor
VKSTLLLKKVIKAVRSCRDLNRLGPKGVDWQVDVSLISDAEIMKLNTKFRKKKSATDVLSFGAPEFFRKSGFLGELILGKGVLTRQAREMGHSPEVETTVLMVHGVLHLLGLDHEISKAQQEQMTKFEEKVLKKIYGKKCSGLLFRGKNHLMKTIILALVGISMGLGQFSFAAFAGEQSWGSRGLKVLLNSTSGTPALQLEFDCAHAEVKSLSYSMDGVFYGQGQYFKENGGPVSPGDPVLSYSGFFIGRTVDNRMVLTMDLEGSGRAPVVFELYRDQPADLVKCL